MAVIRVDFLPSDANVVRRLDSEETEPGTLYSKIFTTVTPLYINKYFSKFTVSFYDILHYNTKLNHKME